MQTECINSANRIEEGNKVVSGSMLTHGNHLHGTNITALVAERFWNVQTPAANHLTIDPSSHHSANDLAESSAQSPERHSMCYITLARRFDCSK